MTISLKYDLNILGIGALKCVERKVELDGQWEVPISPLVANDKKADLRWQCFFTCENWASHCDKLISCLKE